VRPMQMAGNRCVFVDRSRPANDKGQLILHSASIVCRPLCRVLISASSIALRALCRCPRSHHQQNGHRHPSRSLGLQLCLRVARSRLCNAFSSGTDVFKTAKVWGPGRTGERDCPSVFNLTHRSHLRCCSTRSLVALPVCTLCRVTRPPAESRAGRRRGRSPEYRRYRPVLPKMQCK
jgi:hypothetical protein